MKLGPTSSDALNGPAQTGLDPASQAAPSERKPQQVNFFSQLRKLFPGKREAAPPPSPPPPTVAHRLWALVGPQKRGVKPPPRGLQEVLREVHKAIDSATKVHTCAEGPIHGPVATILNATKPFELVRTQASLDTMRLIDEIESACRSHEMTRATAKEIKPMLTRVEPHTDHVAALITTLPEEVKDSLDPQLAELMLRTAPLQQRLTRPELADATAIAAHQAAQMANTVRAASSKVDPHHAAQGQLDQMLDSLRFLESDCRMISRILLLDLKEELGYGRGNAERLTPGATAAAAIAQAAAATARAAPATAQSAAEAQAAASEVQMRPRLPRKPDPRRDVDLREWDIVDRRDVPKLDAAPPLASTP